MLLSCICGQTFVLASDKTFVPTQTIYDTHTAKQKLQDDTQVAEQIGQQALKAGIKGVEVTEYKEELFVVQDKSASVSSVSVVAIAGGASAAVLVFVGVVLVSVFCHRARVKSKTSNMDSYDVDPEQEVVSTRTGGDIGLEQSSTKHTSSTHLFSS